MENEGEEQLDGISSKVSSVVLISLDFIWKESYPTGSIFSAYSCLGVRLDLDPGL